MVAMNVFLTEGENELDRHLNNLFNSTDEEKKRLKDERTQEMYERNDVPVYILGLDRL
jgi:hypothetical protein